MFPRIASGQTLFVGLSTVFISTMRAFINLERKHGNHSHPSTILIVCGSIVLLLKQQEEEVWEMTEGCSMCSPFLGNVPRLTHTKLSWEVRVVEDAGGHLPAVRQVVLVLAACISKYVPSAIVHVQHWLAQATLRVTPDHAIMGSVRPPALSEPSAPADPGNMRCVFVSAQLAGVWARTGFLAFEHIERHRFDTKATEEC